MNEITKLHQVRISLYFMGKIHGQTTLKLAFHFVSWGRCRVKQPSSWHFILFHEEDAGSNNPQVGISLYFMRKMQSQTTLKLTFHFISWGRCTVKQPSSWHFTLFHEEDTRSKNPQVDISLYFTRKMHGQTTLKLTFHFISWGRYTVKQPSNKQKYILTVNVVALQEENKLSHGIHQDNIFRDTNHGP